MSAKDKLDLAVKSTYANTDDDFSQALHAVLSVHKPSVDRPLKPASSETAQQALADKLGLPFVRLGDYQFDEAVLEKVPAQFARKFDLIPLKITHNHLQVAMARPMDQDLYQILNFITGMNIDTSVATEKDIQLAVRKNYGARDDELALESLNATDESIASGIRELERLSNEKPIVRLVSNIIVDAIERHASDIHIRPRAKNVELIYRIDGSLTTIRFFSKSLLAGVVSRIKIIGGMNIAEHRVPQDGRCAMRSNGMLVDMRISVMPTVEGESVVIRLLNSQVGLKSVEELGFNQHDQDLFIDLLHKNNGIFLVTGPTGSGKSTTLYAALAEVQRQNVNIITVEDPVEYHMDGIQQIQINHATGYTFARALRNILRHDPDVILVGEIRDDETAKIAVESALTGHLVLSTLHTNDAAGAVTRLLEMGVQPYLLNGCLLGILAQRLVKKNYPHCLVEEPADALVRESLEIAMTETFYHGSGCENCNQTGISGRMAVYELLKINEAMREEIRPGVTSARLHLLAEDGGMEPLTQNALLRARSKDISLAEVYRVRLG